MFHDRTGEYENAGIEQTDIYFCSLLPGGNAPIIG
jgi:hypothetical protein